VTAPRWIAAAGGLAALAAAAVGLASLGGLGGGGDMPTVKLVRQRFERKITAEGNLKAVTATPLTAPMEARGPLKVAWLAPDGSRVKAGDVVVRFDPTDKEKELEDGRADREVADRRIAKKKTEDGSTLRNLERDAQSARLELDQARTFQSKDPLIFSRNEIIESQIDETLASKRVDHASAARTTRESLSRTDVDLLAIERQKAEIKMKQGEEGLRALEMTAPHDGILTYRRDWRGNTPRVGETVWSGEPLAEIPDLSAMEAEVYVLEADAGGLAVGLPAKVFLEAQPGAAYQAKVKRVDTLAQPRLRGSPVQYFSLTLELERTDPAVMKPGQRVRADLVMDGTEGALVLPREAVFERDGRKVAYRRSGSSFEPVEIALGPTALGRVVVERGLKEGDTVALRDPTRPAEEGEREGEGEKAGAPSGPQAGGAR